MDQNPDVIRQNIEETRSALTEKLETLEHEVFGTVREATQAVSSTVETVKDTVTSTVENVKEKMEETVESVKQTFDLRRQVERHPLIIFGGSVAAGFLLGRWLPTGTAGQSFGSLSASSAVNYGTPRTTKTEPPPRRQSTGSYLSSLLEQFEPELQKVKGLAIGVTMGLVRDAIKERIPEAMVRDFEDLVSNLTTKIGGQPIHGPILETLGGTESHSHGAACGTRGF